MTLASPSDTRQTATFGMADGVVASLALILATYPHGAKVVVVALVGLLVAEGLGMAGSEYLSDPKMSLFEAAVMGVATSLAIILPGLPWLVTSGHAALIASGITAVGIAALIAHLRPGGWSTWLQTFGVLAVVAALAALAGHVA